jgi:hypothetical protein
MLLAVLSVGLRRVASIAALTAESIAVLERARTGCRPGIASRPDAAQTPRALPES